MNEIIQNLKANKTDGYTNFCEINEEMLNAIKKLSQREYEENKKYKEVIEELSEVIHEIDESWKLTNGFPSNYIDCLVNILKEVEND